MKNYISIESKTVVKARQTYSLALNAILFLFGVVFCLINIATASAPIALTAVLFFLSRRLTLDDYLKWLLFSITLIMVLLCWYFDLNAVLFIIQFALLYNIIPLNSAIRQLKKDTTANIFYMNDSMLTCLVRTPFNTNRFGRNPSAYAKTYLVANIRTINIQENYMLIQIKNEVVCPQELTIPDFNAVTSFIRSHHSHLIDQVDHAVLQEKVKKNGWLSILAIIFPPLFFSVLAYLFGNNGKNTPIIMTCLISMCIVPFLFQLLIEKKLK